MKSGGAKLFSSQIHFSKILLRKIKIEKDEPHTGLSMWYFFAFTLMHI
jgi:hypothetical protein